MKVNKLQESSTTVVYRAEYYEPKIDKWVSIGEKTSEEEANKLLDTPIAGNPKMRVQKYEKSGVRKVKYKELNESLDDEDFIYPLGSNTLTAYRANKRISNLKNDIRLLATCNSLEEVQAIKDNFIEYNVPNIILRKIDKGISEIDAIDSTFFYLVKTLDNWKEQLQSMKDSAHNANELFDTIYNFYVKYV